MFIRLLALAFILVTFQASALEVNGELKNAVVEKFASDPVTGLVEGRIYYNTVTKTSRIYDGTVWRNYVDANSTQTITNKTIDGNNNTLTVLAPTQLSGFVPIANGGTGQATKAAAFDALSPNGSQGDLTYRGVSSNVALPIGANTQVLTVSGGYPTWQDNAGGGGGSGEKNYIDNPSALTVITGWTNVGDLDVARSTTASELPREHTTGSGIKITADANVQSVADYVYYDFTLDDVDLNKKLKIQWSQKQFGAYVAGQLAVVITTQADRTTAIATPDVTAIPAYDGVFTASFDTASTATLSLVIRATADMATDTGIVISDVIVGPGQIINAAPIGQIVTPTLTWNNSAGLTIDSAGLTFHRSGEHLIINGVVTFGGVGTDAGNFTLTMAGITPQVNQSGNARAEEAITNYAKTYLVYAAPTEVQFYAQNNGSVQSLALTGLNMGGGTSGDIKNFYFNGAKLRVNEWIGAPNYAGSNDVEYAFSTNTVTTAGNTQTDDGLYGYGPQGTNIVAIASTTAGSSTSKRIRFQTPRQTGEDVFVMIDQGVSGGFVDVASTQIKGSRAGSSIYGISVTPISGSLTDYLVSFGNKGANQSDASYGGNGNEWSGLTAWRWVAVKAKANQAISFGAATSTSMGLIAPYNAASLVHGGTYTPTLSGASNISSLTALQHNYMRVGKIVFVTGAVTGTLTTTGVDTNFSLTVPVSTANFSSSNQASGSGTIMNTVNNTKDAGAIQSNSGAQTIFFRVEGNSSASGVPQNIFYSFSYEIQ